MPIAKSSELQQWTRLATAAITTRDSLRSLSADISSAMATGRIPRELIIRTRDAASVHAESLRVALKHPARTHNRRDAKNVPCWTGSTEDSE